MNRSICFIFFLLFYIPSLTWAQSPVLIADLQKSLRPISTTNPAAAIEDLNFLDSTLTGKTVIGLGESTHGTKEFFELKHRLIRRLVEHQGYKVFAIEAHFAECRAINEYVVNGNGDAEFALKGIYFWTWNTTEVLALINWMRQYNSNKADEDKVQFWGFDMQHVLASANAIMADLKKASIDYSEYQPILSEMTKGPRYNPGNDSAIANVYAVVQKFDKHANTYRDQFTTALGQRTYQLHKKHIDILLQAMQLKLGYSDGYRDSCMAANIKWITEYTGSDKLIVWAHNAHISKQQPERMDEGAHLQMGSYLARIFANKYYAIGFDFGTGQFRAIRTKYLTPGNTYQPEICSVSKKLKSSTNYVYGATGIPIFFLDHRIATLGNNEVSKFLSSPHKTKVIGATYWPKWEKSCYHSILPAIAYDATIYVDHTTPSVPVPKS